jgi:hypothetical protein
MADIPSDLYTKIRRHSNVRRLFELLNGANRYGRALKPRNPRTEMSLQFKQDENKIIYQNEGSVFQRNFENDRHFPLETVMLQAHKLEHNVELEKINIHIGSFSDEYARSFNALALTIGHDIFFRNGAYKPETEEGRKLLAHELTHVAQYEEGRITTKETFKELEEEAERAEIHEEYDDDSLEEVEIYGETFYLRPSEHKEVIHDAIEMTKHWFEEQKIILDEKEYLKLLLKYKRWKQRN